MAINLEEKDIWYLDSGCSRHMTGNRSLLSNIDETNGPTVIFGDNARGKTIGYGSIIRRNLSISKVSLVNGLRHNFLSISQSSSLCLVSTNLRDNNWLWHKGLSHLNFKYLSKLSKEGLVKGIPIVTTDHDISCKACQLGKL